MMFEVYLKRRGFGPDGVGPVNTWRRVINANEELKAVAIAIEDWFLENGIVTISGAPVPFEMFDWVVVEID